MADRKDEIISEQLEIIKAMTERNLYSVGSDLENALKDPFAAGKKTDKKDGKKSGGEETSTKEKKAEERRSEADAEPEKIEDLLAELDSYVGLTEVKEEVKGLINLAKVYTLR